MPLPLFHHPAKKIHYSTSDHKKFNSISHELVCWFKEIKQHNRTALTAMDLKKIRYFLSDTSPDAFTGKEICMLLSALVWLSNKQKIKEILNAEWFSRLLNKVGSNAKKLQMQEIDSVWRSLKKLSITKYDLEEHEVDMPLLDALFNCIKEEADFNMRHTVNTWIMLLYFNGSEKKLAKRPELQDRLFDAINDHAKNFTSGGLYHVWHGLVLMNYTKDIFIVYPGVKNCLLQSIFDHADHEILTSHETSTIWYGLARMGFTKKELENERLKNCLLNMIFNHMNSFHTINIPNICWAFSAMGFKKTDFDKDPLLKNGLLDAIDIHIPEFNFNFTVNTLWSLAIMGFTKRDLVNLPDKLLRKILCLLNKTSMNHGGLIFNELRQLLQAVIWFDLKLDTALQEKIQTVLRSDQQSVSSSQLHNVVLKRLRKLAPEFYFESEKDPACIGSVDIYLPVFKLIIEVDGPEHRFSRNAFKDALLRKQGFEVVHLDFSSIVGFVSKPDIDKRLREKILPILYPKQTHGSYQNIASALPRLTKKISNKKEMEHKEKWVSSNYTPHTAQRQEQPQPSPRLRMTHFPSLRTK